MSGRVNEAFKDDSDNVVADPIDENYDRPRYDHQTSHNTLLPQNQTYFNEERIRIPESNAVKCDLDVN